MGLRFSVEQARELNIISDQQAREFRRSARNARGSRKSAGSKAESPPQKKLWQALCRAYPDWEQKGLLCWEFEGAVPGRKYRIDIAFPEHRCAVELDGWEWHGKNLSNFKRDRERDRLLTLQGWRVMRFFASEIQQDPEQAVSLIEQVLQFSKCEQKMACSCEKAGKITP